MKTGYSSIHNNQVGGAFTSISCSRFSLTPMLSQETLIDRLQTYLRTSSVEAAYIFGSYADGTASARSDIDLIFIRETEKRFFDRYSEFNDLYALFKQAIDLLIYTPREWEEMQERLFFRIMKRDKRIINVYSKE